MTAGRPYRVVTDSVAGPIAYHRLSGRDGFSLTADGVAAEFRIAYRTDPIADGVIGSVPVMIRSGSRGLTRRSFRAAASFDGADYVLLPTSVVSALLRKDDSTVARLWRIGRVYRVTWRHQPRPSEVALCHSLACVAGVGAAGAVARTVGRVLDLVPWP